MSLFDEAMKKAKKAAEGVKDKPELGEEGVAAAAAAALGLAKAVSVDGQTEYFGVSIEDLLKVIKNTVAQMPRVICQLSGRSAKILVRNDRNELIEIATFSFMQRDDAVIMNIDLREATVQMGTFNQFMSAAGEAYTTLTGAAKRGLGAVFDSLSGLANKLMNAESQGKILARITKQISDAVNNYALPISQAYKTQKDQDRVRAQDEEQRIQNLHSCRSCGRPRPNNDDVVTCQCGTWFDKIS